MICFEFFSEFAVAPHVGAWIETSQNTGIRAQLTVAPHVGAWIETGNEVKNNVDLNYLRREYTN
jgi:hypothetical protein